MAKQTLPDLKEKQKLLYAAADSVPTKELVEIGQDFFAQEWFSDAISFFEKAAHSAGIEQIRAKARAQGDIFLLRRCLKALGQEAEDSEWRELADRALELGKLQFAREGYRMAADRKAMDKVDALLAELEPKEPQEPTEESE